MQRRQFKKGSRCFEMLSLRFKVKFKVGVTSLGEDLFPQKIEVQWK